MRLGFEGGQIPYFRRVPKRGFNNARFARTYHIVNLGSIEDKFEAGQKITPNTLLRAGLISGASLPVKVLAKGDLHKALTVKANAFSKGAEEKIKAAGGKAEVI